MNIVERIRAAIAHLEEIAKTAEAGLKHDFDVVCQNVHGLLHQGEDAQIKPAVVSAAPSTQAPAPAPAKDAEATLPPAKT